MFDAALASGRTGSAYLLHGPRGVGRLAGAESFDFALMCERAEGLRSCGSCRPCDLNAAGTHPDFLAIRASTGPFFRDDG